MSSIEQRTFLVEQAPTVEEFQCLRVSVGWGEIDSDTARESIQNTLYWLCMFADGEVVGCGRVIGDGALCFYVQDIIVIPEYQGQRLGHRIMEKIMAYIQKHARRGSFAGLMAAEGVENFYLRYGFMKRPSPGYGPGMIRFYV